MKMSRFLLLGFMLAFSVTLDACKPIKPGLAEYRPEDGSLFKIIFSYPIDWDWEAIPTSTKSYAGMTVVDLYSTGEKIGGIGIVVNISARPQGKMQEELGSHLKGIETLERLELRGDRTLQIDGHYARWLTIINTWEYENPGVTYVQEFIYLLSEDRYYTITLYIPESEMDGQFHTEFKAMIESIQILP